MSKLDKITETGRKRQGSIYYSDVYTNLNKHPETNFLLKSTNENAVKRSLRNLILTGKGERLFQPDLGTNLKQLLFENISVETSHMIKTYILDAVKAWEPRVRIENIIVLPNPDNDLYEIGILFNEINSTTSSSLTLTLSRIR